MDVYYKGSCVTCKRVLAGLDGADVNGRDLFKDPLSEAELGRIIGMSGMRPRELLRKRDRMYRELDMGNREYTDSQLIRLMARNPGLIARPIVVENGSVRVGKAAAGCP